MHDKYGVALDPEMTKGASKERSCPQCGGHNVNYSGYVPRCANCGTEPWEIKPHGKGKEERRR